MGKGSKTWRSEGEWRELLLGYEASGKTQEEYCELAGIALTTFGKWRKRLRDKLSENLPVREIQAGKFIEIPEAEIGSSARVSRVELQLTNGTIIRVWS